MGGTSTFVITFDGSAGTLDSVLAGIRSSVKSAVSDIQSTANKVSLFDSLGDNVVKAQAAFAAASKSAADLADQIAAIQAAGGKVGSDLAQQFKQAQTAATSAGKAYNAQVDQLTSLNTRLTAAGVNTAELASEQTRLAAALKAATAAAAEQSAKSLLGFSTLSDVQPQITALTKAFDTLRLSGTLSADEIAAAEELLAEKIAAVRANVSVLGDQFTAESSSIGSIFSTLSAKVLGVVATVATLSSVLGGIVTTSRAFSQGIIEIGTISEATDEELAKLTESAKELAATFGIDLVQTVTELKNLIRSGLDPDNAVLALAAAAETAKASQQDLGDVVKVTTQLINGYGIQIGDLQKAFGILFQGMKDGGPTFNELADSLGPLLSVAKLANIPLEELAASLQVMVKAGVPAGQAVTDLTKIIGKLDTKAAVTNLAALGVQVDGLVGTFTALSEKGLDLNQTLQLGLTNQKSISGLAALTSGSKGLADEMDRLAKSSNAVADAQARIAATPKEKLDALTASFQVLEANIGRSAAQAGGLYDVVANLLNSFNALEKEELDQSDAVTKFGSVVGIAGLNAAIAFDKILASATAAAGGVKTALSSIAGSVATQIAAVADKVTEITGSLQTLVANIQANIAASQTATTAAITDLNTRATAQIAALDKSTAAEASTAAQTLAIQTKLASDKLAIILKSGSDSIKAANDEAAAVLAIAKASGAQTEQQAQKTASDVLAIRLAPLTAFKNQLQAALADAVTREQTYVGQLNAIDATRVAFNQDVQTKLTDIRNEGLSDFDAYIAKVAQINQLLAQAATAFAQGGAAGLALGKTYTDQAIALTQTLKKVVDENGNEVESAFDVQQQKLGLITKAADQYNAALDGAAKAATDGKTASVAAIDAITPKLADITAQYDALNAKVAEGLAIKITTDEDQIAQALSELDARLAQKAHLVPIQADLAGLQVNIDDVIAKLKKGVTDGVDSELDGIETKLKTIAASAPELKLDIGPATTAIDALRTKVTQIADLKPTLTVDSNVADVQKAIDNLKQPTESTHTVHIKYDGTLPGGNPAPGSSNAPAPGFAKGGAVGSRFSTQPMRAALQRFAAGGAVWKVPGSGNRDTVPAVLPTGSFVLRKAAASMYGDAALMRLAVGAAARRFAGGGQVQRMAGGGFLTGGNSLFTNIGSDQPAPSTQFINTNDLEALTGDIDPPTLPTDAAALKKLVLDYVFNVAAAAVVDDYFFWKDPLRLLSDAKSSYDFAPSDAHLDLLLQRARNIGLNLGLSKNTKIGFDVDGRKWHKELAQGGIPAGLLGALTFEYDFYNKGGNVGDTVPALLTPGEAVINREAARSIGYDFLASLNARRISRSDLASAMRPLPPVRVQRFASGGVVQGVGAPLSGNSAGAHNGGDININISCPPSEFFSTDSVRRNLLPVLREIERRSK
jgi:TP901 family phage tail tape measure protein